MESKVQLLYDEAKLLAKEYGITDKKEYQEFVENKVKQLKKELADKERDERAELRAHEIKQKELDNEIKQKQLELEMNKEKELKELEMNKEKELRETQLKETQLKLTHELELAKLQNTKVEQTNNEKSKHSVRFKMPPFDGKEKIVDFLNLFEATCKGYGIPISEYYIHLIPQLKDKGREALSHIDKEITDYAIIKEQLIKFFIHSEDYYRQKFHNFILTDKIEPRAFVSEVKTFLLTWLDLVKIDTKNPNEIIEIMVVDKVLEQASKPLFTHIMERKVKTVESLIDAISNFKDSHPNVELTKQNQTVNTIQHRRRSYSPPRSRHNQFGNRKKFGNQPKSNNYRCIFCNGTNHSSEYCYRNNNARGRNFNPNFNRSNVDHRGFSNQNFSNFDNRNFPNQNFSNFGNRNMPNQNFSNNNVPNQHVGRQDFPNTQNRPQSNFQNGRNRGKLNNSTSQSNNVIFENRGQLILFPAYVEGKTTYCLRDTGSSIICIDESIIPNQKPTNIIRVDTIKLANGSTINCPVTIIDIDCPWLTGKAEAAIMKNCVAPLIIGNSFNVKHDNSFDIFQKWMNEKSNDLNLKPVLLQNEKLVDLPEQEFYPALQTFNFLQTIGKSENNILNETPNIDLSINNEKDNPIPKWNGTEKLEQYVSKFESQCEINNVPKELHAISLCRHLEGHKQIFNIAKNQISDFTKMKSEILSYIDSPHKKETQMKKTENISLINMPFDELTLKQEQKEDPYIIKMVSEIEKGQVKNKNIEIINGILCRKDTKLDVTQIVIPKTLTVKVMQISHNNALSGHLSSKKTVCKLKKNFWWPKMEKDLKTFIKSCDTCLRHNKKDSKHKAPIQMTDTINKPFYKIAVDIKENIHKNMRKLEVGNKVLVYLPIGSGNTMEWRGPFEIIFKLSDVFYKVNINNKEKIVHLNNLRTDEENKVIENKSEDDMIIENKPDNDISKSEHRKITLNKCCEILRNFSKKT